MKQQKQQQQSQQQQQQSQQQQQQHHPSSAAAAVPKFGAPAAAKKDPPASFVSTQGRTLYAALFKQPSARQRAAAVREMLLPHRLAFAYDFGGADGGGGGGSAELPTTLRRSQADCPPAPDLVGLSTDAVLLGRVGRVVEYVNANLIGKGGQRKPKKQEHVDAIKAILAGGTPEVRESFGGGGRGVLGRRRGSSHLFFFKSVCVDAWLVKLTPF